ncbi:MAG: hypothetical protein B7Z23_05195, partial [Pseudomonadales bacterium 32-61-5]
MSPALRLHPKACLLHATTLLGLLILHGWRELPLQLLAPLLLLLGLWPWFVPWRAPTGEGQAATESQDFAELSKNLSRHT